jgi:hypothetical protein
VRINDITQPCALSGLSKSGAPVVRANAGTRAFSVRAQVASATRAFPRAAGCAGAEGLEQVSFGWRSRELSAAAGTLAGVSVEAGVGVESVEIVEAAGHESVQAASELGLKQVASLAGVGLEVRRPVVVIDGERLAGPAALAALLADGRGSRQMQDEQDQFGTTGVGTEGYAFGPAANGTSPIDPRDFRTSSPPG